VVKLIPFFSKTDRENASWKKEKIEQIESHSEIQDTF